MPDAPDEYGQWWGVYGQDGRLLLLSPLREASAEVFLALTHSGLFGIIEVRREPAADVYLANFLEASRGG